MSGRQNRFKRMQYLRKLPPAGPPHCNVATHIVTVTKRKLLSGTTATSAIESMDYIYNDTSDFNIHFSTPSSSSTCTSSQLHVWAYMMV